MSLRKSVSDWVNDLRYSMAKRGLEGELTNLISTAEGHKAADLPAGHEYYNRLQEKVGDAIGKFNTKAHELGGRPLSVDEVATNVPALRIIKELADGKEGGSAVVRVGIGSVFVAIIGTLVVAMLHNLYLFLTFWANSKWGGQ